MRKIITLLFFVLPFFCAAQKRGNVWCFGDSAGIDFNNLNNPIAFQSGMDSRGSCASIADTSGNLLFYASDPYSPSWFSSLSKLGAVYNKNHQLMQNGDTIIGSAWYNEQIIIPQPGNDSLYNLFSSGVTDVYGFYHTLININANGGLGEVIQKNTQLQSFPNDDCLTAIKHGNGRDWWVFFRRWNPSVIQTNNKFHSYLITPNDVTNYTIQNVGSGSWTGLGKLTFSAQGDKIAFVSYAGLMEIYDFDRCTGVISNPINIFHEVTSPPANRFWGCEFSPNGNLLYATISDQTSYLFQFDLTVPNIAASIDTLWVTSYPSEAIGGLKRGPDGKIYESGPYTNPSVFVYPYPDSMRNVYNENLGVINNPDLLGSGCDFQPYSFYLGGKRTYWGLPNNPDYDMPALAGSPCDSLTTGVANSGYHETKPQLFVTYINGWQKLFVNAQNLEGKNCTLQIFDITGKLIFSNARKHSLPSGGQMSSGHLSQVEGQGGGAYFTTDINCTTLSKGMYIVTLTTESEKLSVKFIRD